MSKGYLVALVAVALAVGAVAMTGKLGSMLAQADGQHDSSVAPVAAQPATVDAAASLLDQALAGQRLVVIGEMHGTQEIPAIAGELAARWSQSQPLLLGLEVASSDQARVDRYLASAGSAHDRAELLAGEHWQEPMHDGRDSVAMVALLERMRALRAGGADVAVALFDAPGEGERNQRMAVALRAAIGAHQRARVLVLTGNVHAMTGEPPAMFDADGKPYQLPTTMARHLVDLRPVSIVVRALRGDFWACQETCGRHPVAGSRAPIDKPELHRNEAGEPWDILLLLPRFTASEPAVPGWSTTPVAETGSKAR